MGPILTKLCLGPNASLETKDRVQYFVNEFLQNEFVSCFKNHNQSALLLDNKIDTFSGLQNRLIQPFA